MAGTKQVWEIIERHNTVHPAIDGLAIVVHEAPEENYAFNRISPQAGWAIADDEFDRQPRDSRSWNKAVVRINARTPSMELANTRRMQTRWHTWRSIPLGTTPVSRRERRPTTMTERSRMACTARIWSVCNKNQRCIWCWNGAEGQFLHYPQDTRSSAEEGEVQKAFGHWQFPKTSSTRCSVDTIAIRLRKAELCVPDNEGKSNQFDTQTRIEMGTATPKQKSWWILMMQNTMLPNSFQNGWATMGRRRRILHQALRRERFDGSRNERRLRPRKWLVVNDSNYETSLTLWNG